MSLEASKSMRGPSKDEYWVSSSLPSHSHAIPACFSQPDVVGTSLPSTGALD